MLLREKKCFQIAEYEENVEKVKIEREKIEKETRYKQMTKHLQRLTLSFRLQKQIVVFHKVFVVFSFLSFLLPLLDFFCCQNLNQTREGKFFFFSLWPELNRKHFLFGKRFVLTAQKALATKKNAHTKPKRRNFLFKP